MVVTYDRFYKAKVFVPDKCWEVRPEPSQGEHLKRAPKEYPQIRLGWKGLPGINTIAYYKHS